MLSVRCVCLVENSSALQFNGCMKTILDLAAPHSPANTLSNSLVSSVATSNQQPSLMLWRRANPLRTLAKTQLPERTLLGRCIQYANVVGVTYLR